MKRNERRHRGEKILLVEATNGHLKACVVYLGLHINDNNLAALIQMKEMFMRKNDRMDLIKALFYAGVYRIDLSDPNQIIPGMRGPGDA